MIISPYQINNVLRVYSDQLRENRSGSRSGLDNDMPSDKIDISAEAKRNSIVDKVVGGLMDRIIRHGPQDQVEKEVFTRLENEYGAQLSISNKGSGELIFKVIDEDGETTNSLSVEDSQILWHKLEEIAKQTVDGKMMK